MCCMGTQLQHNAHLVCYTAPSPLPQKSTWLQSRNTSSVLQCHHAHTPKSDPVVSGEQHWGPWTPHSHHLLGPRQSQQSRVVGDDYIQSTRWTVPLAILCSNRGTHMLSQYCISSTWKIAQAYCSLNDTAHVGLDFGTVLFGSVQHNTNDTF